MTVTFKGLTQELTSWRSFFYTKNDYLKIKNQACDLMRDRFLTPLTSLTSDDIREEQRVFELLSKKLPSNPDVETSLSMDQSSLQTKVNQSQRDAASYFDWFVTASTALRPAIGPADIDCDGLSELADKVSDRALDLLLQKDSLKSPGSYIALRKRISKQRNDCARLKQQLQDVEKSLKLVNLQAAMNERNSWTYSMKGFARGVYAFATNSKHEMIRHAVSHPFVATAVGALALGAAGVGIAAVAPKVVAAIAPLITVQRVWGGVIGSSVLLGLLGPKK